jgi:penicillin-binding protein 1A
MDYERRQHYRGPSVRDPAAAAEVEDAIDDALANHPDNGDAGGRGAGGQPEADLAARADGEPSRSPAKASSPRSPASGQGAAQHQDPPRRHHPRGADAKKPGDHPAARGRRRLRGHDPRTGAIRALVGGFDFDKNKFNHVTQAWRQPGSSFKPFIYSAALEKGFTPATVINDAPLFFSAGATGGQPWEPKNYDGRYDGPMTMRTGLAVQEHDLHPRAAGHRPEDAGMDHALRL